MSIILDKRRPINDPQTGLPTRFERISITYPEEYIRTITIGTKTRIFNIMPDVLAMDIEAHSTLFHMVHMFYSDMLKQGIVQKQANLRIRLVPRRGLNLVAGNLYRQVTVHLPKEISVEGDTIASMYLTVSDAQLVESDEYTPSTPFERAMIARLDRIEQLLKNNSSM